jgi:hypothetical protein
MLATCEPLSTRGLKDGILKPEFQISKPRELESYCSTFPNPDVYRSKPSELENYGSRHPKPETFCS